MRLELASRLGTLAADARDLTELFRALCDETARVMDATVFLFALYDEASETVQVVRQMDRGAEYPGGSFPLGIVPAGQRFHEPGDSNGYASVRPPMVRRGTAGRPPLWDRDGGPRHAPVRCRGPDPVRRPGARCALRAELSTRSLRRCGPPQPERHRRAGGYHRQTSARDGADGPGARTTRLGAGGRPCEHERRPPHRRRTGRHRASEPDGPGASLPGQCEPRVRPATRAAAARAVAGNGARNRRGPRPRHRCSPVGREPRRSGDRAPLGPA